MVGRRLLHNLAKSPNRIIGPKKICGRGFVIFLLGATFGREAQNGAFWGCVPESLALKPSVISTVHPKVMTLMTQYDTVVNEFAWRLFPYEMRWPRLTTIKSVMACSGTYVWMVWGAHCSMPVRVRSGRGCDRSDTSCMYPCRYPANSAIKCNVADL